MSACPNCAGPLDTPLGCPSCGPLPLSDPPPTPFAALGLPQGYEVDPRELEKRLVRFSRLLHPDFYGGAGEGVRELAERNTAELNAAYETLADDYRRADWLVRALGGPDQDAERQMPQAFLMEVLEWNETLEAAREAPPGSPERGELDALADTLAGERGETMEAVRARLSELPEEGAPALVEVRRHLNAVRYVDRALSTIANLRLEQARQT